MIPPQFDYVRPATLAEALTTLRDREGEAKVLAGGYSLLPLLKLRLAQPALLVDLRDVRGIDGIEETADELRIGGRATHRRIHEHSVVAARYPLIHDASVSIGDPQIRNWGTIGGSCAHADPSADWPAALIAAGATFVLQSTPGKQQSPPQEVLRAEPPDTPAARAGTRLLPAREFFIDTFQTAIEPTEILTSVRVPRPGPRSGGAYAHLERRSGDFSTVGAGVQLQLAQDGRIASIGIGLTAVAPAPFAATDAEAALTGAPPTDDAIRAACQAAAAQSQPYTDSHGPAEYKRAMVSEMLGRAIRTALQRARTG